MTTVKKLVYSIFMKADTGGAKQAAEAADKAGKAWDNMAGKVAYAGAAIGGVLASLGFLVGNTAAFSEEVERSARGLAMTTTQFQAYKAGFDALGASTDDLMDAFGTLVDRSTDAMEGNKEYTKEFKRIGIAVDELKGKKAHEIFDLYIDRATKVKDRNQAITSAVRLFGDDLGRRLLPVMVESGESFKSLTNLVNDTGLALDEVAIKDLRTTAFEARRLTFIAKGLGRDLAAELAPAFTRVGQEMGDIATERAPELRKLFDEVGDEALKWAEKTARALRDINEAAGEEKNIGRFIDTLYRLGLVLGAGMVGVGVVAGVLALGSALTGLSWPVVALFVGLSILVRYLEDLWVHFHGGLSLTGALGSKFEWLGGMVDELKWWFTELMKDFEYLGQDFRELIGLFTQEGPEGFSILEAGLAVLHWTISLVLSAIILLVRFVVNVIRIFVIFATAVVRVTTELKFFWNELKQGGKEAVEMLERVLGRFGRLGAAIGRVTGRGVANLLDSPGEDTHGVGAAASEMGAAGRDLVTGNFWDAASTATKATSFLGDSEGKLDMAYGMDQLAKGRRLNPDQWGMPTGRFSRPAEPTKMNQDVRVNQVNIQLPPGTALNDPQAFGRSAAEAFQSELLMSEDVLMSGPQ